MKKLAIPPPAATKTACTILKQVVKLIPPQIVLDAAAETKVLSRTFTPWSHLLALACLQPTKTESLNGVCAVAEAYKGEWARMRGAQHPRRNTLSNANRRRVSKRRHSFSRLADVVRVCAWLRRNVVQQLESYGPDGTARGGIRWVEVAKPLHLQCLLDFGRR